MKLKIVALIGNLLSTSNSQKKIQSWWAEAEPRTILICPLVKGNRDFQETGICSSFQEPHACYCVLKFYTLHCIVIV